MSETPHRNHDSYFVPGLQRGLLLLELLAAERRPLSLTELAKRLSLTRSSVFRLAYTLRMMGFIASRDGAKTVALGPRVLNIGFAYLAGQDIIETARPDQEALRDLTQVSSHLAIRDGQELLYLSCVQTRSGYLSNMNVGSRLPAYASPMGWLLLGELSTRELAALFEGRTLEPLTSQTPPDIPALARCVGQAIADGYVVSRGVMEPGGSSISAPVFDSTGRVVAAIDISGPDSAFDLSVIESFYVPQVRAAAERISARLGYASPRPLRVGPP